MANNPKGLGKGLAALLGDDVIDSQEEKSSLFLPISQVESCASQPRKQFDPESLADLADSIREHGIIQPLTVRKLQSGYYQIIAGERRWRAARMAGLTQVPAIVIEADDRKAMELAMIENLQREDLNPIEEAEGYQVLMSQYSMTQEETAQRVGILMGQAKKDPSKLAEAEEAKAQVKANADRLAQLEEMEGRLTQQITKIMMVIPQMIDPSVPIGPDDSHNVEVQRFGEAKLPEFDIPYHTEIMERFDGIDMDAAGRVSGNGFYYLMGDIARLHEAVLAYGRDFMIDKGFTYCIPPFMIHGNVVEGVMSQTDMDAMMYKIEGEDLYLIGTSEHSMIGKFIDQIVPAESLPQTLTSYSPCFRKEKGAHGIEERGIYRIHQFEKQEMIVVCKPEDSKKWYEQLWRYSVELFRSLDIPVRQLECCSGDLADLKCKSCDIEAWSPRQQKYFEVCSCSNLGDAQARRLKIRYKDENGRMQLCHTLNNTCVAPPRMLIAFLENNLQADGSVLIPQALRPYMGGHDRIVPKH